MYVTMEIFTYGGRNISFAPYGSKPPSCSAPSASCPTAPSGRRRPRGLSPAPVNLTERIKVVMNDILMRCAIGDTSPIMRDEYIQALDKGLKLMAGFNLIDLFPGSRLARMLGGGSLRAAMELHNKIDSIIQDHATSGDADHREDILDLLLRFQREGGLGITLTRQVLSGVMFDIFSAGSETTSTTTIWAMSELARNPGVMERAQSEVRQVLHGKSTVKEEDIQGRLPYLQMVIKETLRLHPPAPLLLPRHPSECRGLRHTQERFVTVLVFSDI
ncbi:hypothetical protein EJB05_18888, partial [Eragrostis curvula]